MPGDRRDEGFYPSDIACLHHERRPTESFTPPRRPRNCHREAHLTRELGRRCRDQTRCGGGAFVGSVPESGSLFHSQEGGRSGPPATHAVRRIVLGSRRPEDGPEQHPLAQTRHGYHHRSARVTYPPSCVRVKRASPAAKLNGLESGRVRNKKGKGKKGRRPSFDLRPTAPSP